jgi:hypothetical protein
MRVKVGAILCNHVLVPGMTVFKQIIVSTFFAVTAVAVAEYIIWLWNGASGDQSRGTG